jgi:membrane protein YqaA with SNARE-associated domain
MESTRTLGLLGGSFLFGLGSGLVPFLNTEAFVMALAAVAPPSVLVPVVVLTTLGQMVAKSLLYLAGSGVVSLPLLGGRGRGLGELRDRLDRERAGAAAVVFASATIGLPPFYLLSVVAGSLRWPLARFLLVGGGGRLLRFAVIAALPRFLGIHLP